MEDSSQSKSFSTAQFSQRKSDHIRIALDPRVQAEGMNGLDKVTLTHEALPNMNFSEVDISASFFSHKLSSPIFISSMTAGHEKGLHINTAFAKLSARHKILMGVGSQRRELNDSEATKEWQQVRAQAPEALLLGNLGIAQLIQTKSNQVQKLVDSLGAIGLFVHLNSLQECLQPEGTTDFKDGLKAIENLTKTLSVPVIIKEVGCGFSAETLKRFNGTGVHAVDVSGFGGTHWGRIEGLRSGENEMLYKVAETFANWGVSTAQSMRNALEVKPDYKIWASGGVRNGLEVAKLLAMGASHVGVAKPFLDAVMAEEKSAEISAEKADQQLDKMLLQMELELKIALFCTGSQSINDLQKKQVWKWQG